MRGDQNEELQLLMLRNIAMAQLNQLQLIFNLSLQSLAITILLIVLGVMQILLELVKIKKTQKFNKFRILML